MTARGMLRRLIPSLHWASDSILPKKNPRYFLPRIMRLIVRWSDSGADDISHRGIQAPTCSKSGIKLICRLRSKRGLCNTANIHSALLSGSVTCTQTLSLGLSSTFGSCCCTSPSERQICCSQVCFGDGSQGGEQHVEYSWEDFKQREEEKLPTGLP